MLLGLGGGLLEAEPVFGEAGVVVRRRMMGGGGGGEAEDKG